LILPLAVEAATVFSHPSTERPLIAQAGAAVVTGSHLVVPTLLEVLAAAARVTAPALQQTQVAVVVVAEAKQVEPALADQA
jgi:hypothetical protein